MSALGEATFIWPKVKEGVQLCMDVNQYAVNGKIVYDVSCPNCIQKGVTQPKSWRLPAGQGLGNVWSHFRACVDDNAALEQMIKAARHAKAERQRAADSVSKYIDCRFILGSAAIVERLWGKQDNLLFPPEKNADL